jgi:hypothetical protein
MKLGTEGSRDDGSSNFVDCRDRIRVKGQSNSRASVPSRRQNTRDARDSSIRAPLGPGGGGGEGRARYRRHEMVARRDADGIVSARRVINLTR